MDTEFEKKLTALVIEAYATGEQLSMQRKPDRENFMCEVKGTVRKIHKLFIEQQTAPVQQGHYDSQGYCDNPARGY